MTKTKIMGLTQLKLILFHTIFTKKIVMRRFPAVAASKLYLCEMKTVFDEAPFPMVNKKTITVIIE